MPVPRLSFFALLVACPLLHGSLDSTVPIRVTLPEVADHPAIRYALERYPGIFELQSTGDEDRRHQVTISIDTRFSLELGEEGYRLRASGRRHVLEGTDPKGILYGLLDLAERWQTGGLEAALQERIFRPPVRVRAIKFNLPWMPYRPGDHLLLHDATCRDPAFWETFLDMMVDNRFNTLTLWSLHPFHLMVKSPSYPEANILPDSELAQWQQLWQRLFSLAEERGIETFLVNWNIFVPPGLARAHEVANWSEFESYLGEGTDSELVVDYTREMVTEVINTYPNLTGLGITLGERMGGMSPDQRRDWLDRTFLQGLREAERSIKFLYRAPLSANRGSGGSTSAANDRATREQIEFLEGVRFPVYVSFKYNWSHGHSSPKLFHVHGGELTDAYWNPEPEKHTILWTIRNEDFHVLRWGDPDYVRAHLRESFRSHTGGYILGSETYIPAADYISRPGEHAMGKYAFERQWLYYLVWGRLLYDPETPDDWFAIAMEDRFAGIDGDLLLQAWKTASKMPLRFASFYKGTHDATLYSEGHCRWEQMGGPVFLGVEQMLDRPVLDTDRYINIREWVESGEPEELLDKSPLACAEAFEKDALEVLRLVDQFRRLEDLPPGLQVELKDLECWAWYGRFSAGQIRGCVDLQRMRSSGKPEFGDRAATQLRDAGQLWAMLAREIRVHNHEFIPFFGGGPFSWGMFLDDVDRDFRAARLEARQMRENH
ncbi:MAG: hypothetical protein AB3N64_00900 [Puniceicoccaceae bacterium]